MCGDGGGEAWPCLPLRHRAAGLVSGREVIGQRSQRLLTARHGEEGSQIRACCGLQLRHKGGSGKVRPVATVSHQTERLPEMSSICGVLVRGCTAGLRSRHSRGFIGCVVSLSTSVDSSWHPTAGPSPVCTQAQKQQLTSAVTELRPAGPPATLAELRHRQHPVARGPPV